MSDQQGEQLGEQQGAQFVMQRIYMKDMSFESPRAPGIFRTQWKPKVNLDLNSRYTEIEPDLYEVILSLTITTRDDAEDVVYLVEVQQAGIFMIRGLGIEALDQTLGSFCPNVLFPYARETIDSIVTKGSYPPLMLAPVNFDAIYEQTRQQRDQPRPQ